MASDTPGFVHLHLHTHLSLLDGSIRIPELAEQVAKLGMTSVAVTDHGNLFAAFGFHKAALKQGIRPIIGCEVYVAPFDHKHKERIPGRKPYDHLVLLAENNEGYKNLTYLVSQGSLEGFYHKPRISKDLLAGHSRGLIGMSACLSGEIPRRVIARDQKGAAEVAEQYREILGPDNFFLEIQDHGTADETFVREGLAELSRTTGLPLVATNDCHFHNREDMFAHRIMLGIGLGNTLDELQSRYVYNGEFYIKSPQEMYSLFSDYPGSCERTVEIAERCHVMFDTSTMHLPQYPVPENYTLVSYLDEISREGLEKRLADGRQRKKTRERYFNRLEFELEVIQKMGFPGYFLVVWDFIQYSKNNGIPVGPGRGSAAGSVVSYSLEITDIDPLEYDLIFERFLNPGRISMPDIDIDFCQRNRDRVIKYVRNLYGDESVCQIATFNILKAKSAVRDVGRVLDMPFSDVDRIAKLIPDDLKMTVAKALKETPELKTLFDNDEDVHMLLETADRLEGLARHCGIHAAGVVIASEPLVDLLPLLKTKDGDICTQFDKDEVEELGLLKMDFLGLRTLTVIDDALESIKRVEGIDLDIANLPLDDESVYRLFSDGDTDGIFQFESSGMKEALRKVEPRVFLDLAALNALYRPGPMQFIDDFAARRHGRKGFSYIFPELEEILGETYGIIIYQEQVMQIAVTIAGFSLAKADTLRKAMGKKKKDIIDREGVNFVEGAAKNKFPKEKAKRLWEQIVPFAEYGFNKSHSVAYAQVAYSTAYLKAHFPAHFMAAMLTSEVSNTDKLSQYLGRCKEMGMTILPPDINRSEVEFSVEDGGIRFGLSAIKGVGTAAVGPVLEIRNSKGAFTSIAQCLRSLPQRTMNNKVMEALVKAGCFDAFGATRYGVLQNLEQLMELASREREQDSLGQGFLFDDLPSETLEAETKKLSGASDSERLTWERDVLGFYLTGHPLDAYKEQLGRFANSDVNHLSERAASGEEGTLIGGLVTGLKIMPIKKEGRNQGRKMGVFTLEDATGSVRVVVFPDAFDKFNHQLNDDNVVLLRANFRGDDDHVELTAEEIHNLDTIEAERAAALRIDLDLEVVNEALLEQLRDYLLDHNGTTPVVFRLRRRGNFTARLLPPPALTIKPSPEFCQSLANIIGEGRWEFEFKTQTSNNNGAETIN